MVRPALEAGQQHIFMMTMVNRDKFDFEIGFLIKSPCKNCERRKQFPACHDTCSILDGIRGILARGVSCTYSAAE